MVLAKGITRSCFFTDHYNKLFPHLRHIASAMLLPDSGVRSVRLHPGILRQSDSTRTRQRELKLAGYQHREVLLLKDATFLFFRLLLHYHVSY